MRGRYHRVSQCRWAEGRKPNDLLFPAPEGGYLLAQNVQRAVRWSTTGQGRHRHDLRHTAATFLLAQGVDARTIMETLGHSQISLTLNTYSHVLPALQQEAAAKLDAILTR